MRGPSSSFLFVPTFLLASIAAALPRGYLTSDRLLQPEDLLDAPGLRPGAMPSLLILGVAKGGTTKMYDNIMRDHGHLFSTPVRKELNYLNNDKFSKEEYLERLNATGSRPFTVDATPSYIFGGNEALRNLRHMTPHATMIVLIREPVARTRSLFNHWLKFGIRPYGDMTFEEAMAWELDLLQKPGSDGANLIDQLLHKTGVSDESNQVFVKLLNHVRTAHRAAGRDFRAYSVLVSSIYGYSLESWANYFRPGRALVMQSEWVYSDFEAVMTDVVSPLVRGGSEEPGRFTGRWNKSRGGITSSNSDDDDNSSSSTDDSTDDDSSSSYEDDDDSRISQDGEDDDSSRSTRSSRKWRRAPSRKGSTTKTTQQTAAAESWAAVQAAAATAAGMEGNPWFAFTPPAAARSGRELDEYTGTAGQSSRTYHQGPAAMSAELACRLSAFFRPFVEHLRDVLASPELRERAFVLPPPEEGWWRRVDYCQSPHFRHYH